MKFRSAWGYDVEEASEASGFRSTDPSLTVQSQSEDADLNVMMKRFGVTGQFPQNARVPEYGDFEHITDFRSAIEAVRQAQSDFDAFPAEVRAYFQNNPQMMLDFVSNPANIPQFKQLIGEQNASRVGNIATASGSQSQTVGEAASAGAGAPGEVTK